MGSQRVGRDSVAEQQQKWKTCLPESLHLVHVCELKVSYEHLHSSLEKPVEFSPAPELLWAGQWEAANQFAGREGLVLICRICLPCCKYFCDGWSQGPDRQRRRKPGAPAGGASRLSTPPAPGLNAHLWSPAHFSKVIIKRDRQADAKRPDSGTQRSAEVPGNARSEMESKGYFFFILWQRHRILGTGSGMLCPRRVDFH